jgi:hypothetical protein
MEALFGEDRLQALRGELDSASPTDREAILRRGLGDALLEKGAPYLIPFRFLRAGGRPSHYICFVTKNRLGYSIMKDIMAARGVVDDDGVPKFEYLPPLSGRQLPFDEARPILNLPADLLRTFAGRTLTRQQVYDEHNVGTPFIESNYRKVLIELEEQGRIVCSPPATARRRGTLAEHVRITFP